MDAERPGMHTHAERGHDQKYFSLLGALECAFSITVRCIHHDPLPYVMEFLALRPNVREFSCR